MIAHGNQFSGPGKPLFLTEYRPGHVFWLPPGRTWMNLEKPRPFALATWCSPGVRGTLVYGSTRETEKKSGAASIHVTPRHDGVNRNGLRAGTFFYPGALFRTSHEELPGRAGTLGQSLPALRASLRHALGIGLGSCLSSAAPPGSRRGRIVELKPDFAMHVRTRFAVLLTEPRYSRVKHYHIVLPVFPRAAPTADERLLCITGRSWLAAFPHPALAALLPVRVTQSVWYTDDIAHETEYVVDDDTLAEIDRLLCDYFSLPLEGG